MTLISHLKEKQVFSPKKRLYINFVQMSKADVLIIMSVVCVLRDFSEVLIKVPKAEHFHWHFVDTINLLRNHVFILQRKLCWFFK